MGLIYGPSGCGKSSLVKAGLIPRLAEHVLPVYLEATSNETESRLLHGLRKRCPGLPTNLDLKGTLAALRRGHGVPHGTKVLIVIDQFEQWLHSKGHEENTELVQAVRQCDGGRVQCIVMVRDDFWLAVSRFMRALEIRLLDGQNAALVDLFDVDHAKKCLRLSGVRSVKSQRFGARQVREQRQFLDEAVHGLAQEGKVVCVRLALFAEMMKGKPWTTAALKEVGGTEGIGVTFLEETFSATTAPPEHRYHQKAARAVLKALLPEPGIGHQGHMRSHDELLEVSGYANRSKEFEELIRILDSEIRLITPTDPEGSEAADDSKSKGIVGQKYYQLTHDYLVPSLRDWLTRKQRETRRGRAELRLGRTVGPYGMTNSDNRLLPSLWEFLNIRLLTDQQEMDRGPAEDDGKGRASTWHSIGSGRPGDRGGCCRGIRYQGQIEEKRQADYAASLVDQLIAADITEVPAIVRELDGYRHWVDPLLRQEDAQAKKGSNKMLHLALALLPVDHSKIGELRDDLVLVSQNQFSVVRNALLPYRDSVTEPLWNVALDTNREAEQRFQAACALATYAPDDKRWSEINTFVAGHLVNLEASALVARRETLRPAKDQLIKPLAVIYRDTKQKEQSRIYATETLADFAADQPDELFNLFADAEQFQFPVMFGKLTACKDKAVALADQELARKPPEKASEDDKECLAKRQANAAVALLRLGTPERVWPLLKFSPDPRVRSYIIHWLSPLGGDPQPVIQRLEIEPDITIRRALVLTLGQFTEAQLSVAQRQPLIEKLAGRLRK